MITKRQFKFISALFLSTIILSSCGTEETTAVNPTLPMAATAPFVNPPLTGVNVEFQQYSVDAAKGDTLDYKTGSKIFFPEDAFVDESGKIVEGEVDIKYREFRDPADFFLSGITMSYDSNGVDYLFESAGMLEITATKNGEQVFVNPESQPSVYMASDATELKDNLYFLDTNSQQWVYNGTPLITDLEEVARREAERKAKAGAGRKPMKETKPLVPVKPRRASGDRPVFSIDIDPYSVPELQAYNNLLFEVHENDKNYDPSHAEIEWYDMTLKPAKTSGTYFLTFSSGKRKETYLVRPVLKGKDYKAALKVFSQKQREYKELLAQRLKREKEVADSIEAAYQKYERIQDSLYKVFEVQKDSIYKEQLKAFELQMASMDQQSKTVRSFQLAGFGVWNCDQPVLRELVRVRASFNIQGIGNVDLHNTSVVYKDFNGMYSGPSSSLPLTEDTPCMIWAIHDGKFCYLSYSEFEKLKIDPMNPAITFNLRAYPKEIKGPQDIRELL